MTTERAWAKRNQFTSLPMPADSPRPLAAPALPEPGLDAAWAEAEAALPEGWDLGITRTTAPVDYDAWAQFQEDEEDPETIQHRDETGPTPAAALRALAAALREGRTPDGNVG